MLVPFSDNCEGQIVTECKFIYAALFICRYCLPAWIFKELFSGGHCLINEYNIMLTGLTSQVYMDVMGSLRARALFQVKNEFVKGV